MEIETNPSKFPPLIACILEAESSTTESIYQAAQFQCKGMPFCYCLFYLVALNKAVYSLEQGKKEIEMLTACLQIYRF